MTRNQLMAKVLYSNKLVSEKQIQELWGKIDPAHDIGVLFVQAGILEKDMYARIVEYVDALESKMAAAISKKQESVEEKRTVPPTKGTVQKDKIVPESKPEEPAVPSGPVVSAAVTLKSVAAKPQLPEEKSESIALEGNNPYGQSSASSVQIEKVEGLEQTSIAAISVVAKTEQKKGLAENVSSSEESSEKIKVQEKLPDRFEIARGEGSVAAPEQLTPETPLQLILSFARKYGATDIYFSKGSQIAMRVCGVSHYVSEAALDGSQLTRLLAEAASGFADGYEPVVGADFSKTFALRGAGRARLTVNWEDSFPALAVRVISTSLMPLDKLYLPPFSSDFLSLPSGLVLVAGPSGSGRSTTLCSFGEAIAKRRYVFLQTIEKPIERLLENPLGVVVQKEVGLHTHSGSSAILEAVGDGVNVILFDHIETMDELWLLLQAASAGALVFAVSSGNNVLGLFSRILSTAGERRSALASALAEQLKGVIVQHLVPVIDNQGQILAVEAMKVTSSIANLIRREELTQLPSAIAAAKNQGVTLDDSLQGLVESGYINGEEAWQRSLDRRRFASYRPARKVKEG
ncbi:MAG: Flp pilus assembly complex ATPase component TadA [Fibrobacteraceae bacterium]|nr:Flp pilus assembly complex ATPase component TadA [Fibrobacteraceae bacterium]